MRGTIVSVVAGAALWGCRDPRPPAPPAAAAGTYRVAVCKAGPCAPTDTAHALVLGHLVLAAAPIPPGALPAAARAELPAQFLPGAANGCFALARGRGRGQTFAGLAPAAATHWQADAAAADAIRFVLYRSPDAAHDVRAVVRAGALRGRGTSWGPGADERPWPPDTVVAVRVGPPDLRRCDPGP